VKLKHGVRLRYHRVSKATLVKRRDERKRLAFRCLQCHEIFCRACANRHFAPIERAERRLGRLLEAAAVRAMRGLERSVGEICKPPGRKTR